jgi:hypothetical protein
MHTGFELERVLKQLCSHFSLALCNYDLANLDTTATDEALKASHDTSVTSLLTQLGYKCKPDFGNKLVGICGVQNGTNRFYGFPLHILAAPKFYNIFVATTEVCG